MKNDHFVVVPKPAPKSRQLEAKSQSRFPKRGGTQQRDFQLESTKHLQTLRQNCGASKDGLPTSGLFNCQQPVVGSPHTDCRCAGILNWRC